MASAEGDLAAAGAIPNPTLSAGIGHSFLFGHCTGDTGEPAPCPSYPPALSASISDGAALSDSLSGKRGLRLRVAREALAAARLSRDDALRSLEGQVKQQFVQVLVAQESLAFAREVADAQARTAALSKARLEAGAISEADLARIDTAWLESDQAVDQARATLRTAQLGLAFFLGARAAVPEFEVVAGELARATVSPGLSAATRDSVLRQAFEARLDLLAAQRTEERARAGVDLARRERWPDFTLSLSYAQQGTTQTAVSPPTVSLGVSVPLPLFYRQQGEIEKAEADASTQSLALAKAESTVVSDVETAWAGFEGSRALVERMENGLLERAKTAFDLVTIQYQRGAGSLLDLLDAQRTYTATELEYLQDVSAYWQSVFRLEQAAGVVLR